MDTLRATPEGELVLAGRFSEGIDIGGKKLRSNGGTDALVAKIDRSGAVQWAKSFGGKDDDEAAALDLDRSGRVAAIGNFQNEAEFGATTLTAKTYPRTWHAGKSFGMVGTDAWLAVLSPEGEVASAKAFGFSNPSKLGSATISPRMIESVESFRSDMTGILGNSWSISSFRSPTRASSCQSVQFSHCIPRA